jgi:type IV pilus assembly protein PilV
MRGARGYTVIEVMIALTLLAIGTSGIIAMQKVTSVTNRDSKNLLMANQIARTWVERLRADAVQWNHPSNVSGVSDLDDTLWLKTVDGAWHRPIDDTRGSPTSDAFGSDVPDALADTNGAFCTNIRLSWLYGPPGANVQPPFLIRAEIRVYWLRDGMATVDGEAICHKTTDLNLVAPAVDRYHFVYVTSAVAQNMAM